jgi:hypothetical protein
LVRPSTAWRHTRHSAEVSALLPVNSIRARRPGPAWSSARALREHERAAFVRDRDRPALDVAALTASPEATQLGAEVGERVRQVKPRGRPLEHCDRVLEQRQAFVVGACKRRCAERPADGCGTADAPGGG